MCRWLNRSFVFTNDGCSCTLWVGGGLRPVGSLCCAALEIHLLHMRLSSYRRSVCR
jgi:hypothetical protein